MPPIDRSRPINWLRSVSVSNRYQLISIVIWYIGIGIIIIGIQCDQWGNGKLENTPTNTDLFDEIT